MKYLLIGLIMMGWLCPTFGSAASQKIVLVSTEYPPYYGERLPHFGGISEIIVEAYRRVGYEVAIKFYPWPRGLQMTKNGECDGMFTLWHNQEREQWFVFSTPLPSNEIGFYKRKADPIHFASYLLKTALPEYQEELEWLEPSLETMPQYLVISKQVQDYQRKIDDFNRGFAQLVQDGLVSKIRSRHGF